VLDRFAGPEWKEIEKEWHAGRIGSRLCLARQIGLVQADPKKLTDLVQEIRVDSHFISFLKTAKQLAVPVAIVSDGFDLLIHGILMKHLEDAPELLEELPVYCNRLEWDGTHFRAAFPAPPCEHGCANCKEALIRKLAVPNERTVFVGDGWSDRFAAKVSDFTFAKEELLEFCQKNGIEHKTYTDFETIDRWLVANAVRRPEAVV
jgi:2-hydroxy-3-keto-5-methylthiopentenyl-1-phosphate phosphatase